jgi:hypothetical protein
MYGTRVLRMPDLNDIHDSEMLAMEGFLNEIQDLIRDLVVVVEMNRLCKNEYGHLTAFGNSALTEGINRGTPVGVLTRMIGITKQAVWERRSNKSLISDENDVVGQTDLDENLYAIRTRSLLRRASTLSRSMLRLRLLLKNSKGNRLSVFGKEFLIIALKNKVETGLIASVLDVSPSYIALFRRRIKPDNS